MTFCLTSPSWFHSILFTIFARQRVIKPERQKPIILVILTAISSPYLYRDCGKHLIFILSHSRSRARVRASRKAARNEGRSPSIILLFHSVRLALKKERRPLAITQTVRLDYQPLFGKMSPHSSPEIIFDRGTLNTLEILSGKSETLPFNLVRAQESVSSDPQKTQLIEN